MFNIDEGQSTHPTRALCEVVKEANWYTNVLTSQPVFNQCLLLRPELQNLVEKVCSFERRIFAGPDSQLVYAELRTLLRYCPPSSTAPSFAAQVSETGIGSGWAKFHLLMLYYRLFDRVWLYNSPLNPNILVHPNKHQRSSYESWSHIEDVQKLLRKFRKLCTDNLKATAGENGNTIIRLSIFSPRLPKGCGLVQQLKDLAALDDTLQLVKIQHNLLLAALSLNWMCQVEVEKTQSDSSSLQAQPHADSSTAAEDASANLQAIISYRSRSSDLSDEEVEKLKKMFNTSKKDGSPKGDVVHKNLLIALGITPLFLLATVHLDKSSRWSNINIYKESQELGNWHPDLLVRIEKTILDSVFDIASGSMDAAQALFHITNSLPWEEIDAMSAEDPVNIRFRRVAAPSQPMQSLEKPFSSEASSLMQQAHNTTVAHASGITPPSRTPRPPTPPPSHTPPPSRTPPPSCTPPPSRTPPPLRNPSPSLSPLTPPPSTSVPLALSHPNAKGKTRESSGQNPEEDEVGDDDGSAARTDNDEDMNVDSRPTRTRRARNPPSTPSMPPPEPTTSSKNRRVSTKRKRDNTATKEFSGVPKPTNPSDKGGNRSTLVPETLLEMPKVSLVLGKKFIVPKETSLYMLYCAKGQPHQIVFKAHTPKMLQFWCGVMESVKRSYIDQKALHVVDQTRSTFSVLSHSALEKKSAAEKLELLRRGPILETDRPTAPISFDVEGLKSLGCSLSKVIDIQDQSVAIDQTKWGQYGTLKMMLECPAGKALNALSLPMPEGSHSAGSLSTDYVAWEEAACVEKNVENNSFRPTEITRWGLCATAGASHTFHIDSDRFATFVEVLTGTKIWVVVRPKENIADFSEFGKINRYLTGSLEMYDPDKETCEAVILTPGTRLYMRPNIMHVVHTSDNAICHGGHFYASSTMKDTLYPARHHLPKLNPLENSSNDSHMNSIEAAEELFVTCSLAIFMSVLHPATYLHPDVAFGGEPDEQQQQEMEVYDRNAMSLEECIACVSARAMAYKALKWFARNYRFVARNGQPPKQCQEILDEKLAEQAYTIYLAKATAVSAKVKGFPGCSLDAVERQLRGMFPIESGAQDILEHHFEDNTQLEYIHANFSGWGLETITSPTREDDTTTTSRGLLESWLELTPLDIKFSEGLSADFKIDSSEHPHKKRKVV